MAILDVDETDLPSDPQPLRGFKKTWQPPNAATSNVLESSVDDVRDVRCCLFLPGIFHGRHEEPSRGPAVTFDWKPFDQFTEFTFQDASAGVDSRLQGSGAVADFQDATPKVLDPQILNQQEHTVSPHKQPKQLGGPGQLHPLRVSETNLNVVLCGMRSRGAGATTAQHVLELLTFLMPLQSLLPLISIFFSARNLGVTKDLYFIKTPSDRRTC